MSAIVAALATFIGTFGGLVAVVLFVEWLEREPERCRAAEDWRRRDPRVRDEIRRRGR